MLFYLFVRCFKLVGTSAFYLLLIEVVFLIRLLLLVLSVLNGHFLFLMEIQYVYFIDILLFLLNSCNQHIASC